MLAPVLSQLAAHKVQRLNAIGTFIDHSNTGIAGKLGHAPFFDIAMATIDLLSLHAHIKAFVT